MKWRSLELEWMKEKKNEWKWLVIRNANYEMALYVHSLNID